MATGTILSHISACRSRCQRRSLPSAKNGSLAATGYANRSFNSSRPFSKSW